MVFSHNVQSVAVPLSEDCETGHKSYDCKANKWGQTQQAAAMQVLEPSVPTTQQTRHNVCNENHKCLEMG